MIAPLLLAQIDPTSQTQLTLVQWAVKEGGAYVVILLILFFYRRDWQKVVSDSKDQLAILTTLVINATVAQTKTAAALEQNTVVVHQAKRVMETYLPDIPLQRAGERASARRGNGEAT